MYTYIYAYIYIHIIHTTIATIRAAALYNLKNFIFAPLIYMYIYTYTYLFIYTHTPVYTIRAAAAQNLKNLTEVFGVDWAAVYLIPPVMELCSHSNYLYRMTAIWAIAHLCAVVPKEHVLRREMVQALVVGVKDPVPNCRFNAAKAIQHAGPHLDSSTLEVSVALFLLPCRACLAPPCHAPGLSCPLCCSRSAPV